MADVPDLAADLESAVKAASGVLSDVLRMANRLRQADEGLPEPYTRAELHRMARAVRAGTDVTLNGLSQGDWAVRVRPDQSGGS